MKIVVTGGAGFIGSALVRHLIGHTDHEVLVVDKLTYAGNLASLASVQGHPRYQLQPNRHLRSFGHCRAFFRASIPMR